MFYYAITNQYNICTAVIQSLEESGHLSHVKIGSLDTSYLNKKYENGSWSTELYEIEADAKITEFDTIKERMKNSDVKYQELDKTTATLEEVRVAKIEQLKYLCTKSIYAGFISSVTDVNGVAYEFGFNNHDQINIGNQLNKVNLWKNNLSDGTFTQADYDAKFPIKWKAKNIGVVSLTETEFLKVTDDGETHLLNQQGKYWNLESQVLSCTTITEIDSIVW